MKTLHYQNESLFQNFQQLDIEVNAEQKSVWLYFNSFPRPCFTPTLFEELARFQSILKHHDGRLSCAGEYIDIEYSIITSRHPVFSLGGDLNYFIECVHKRDRNALAKYARLAIDGMYFNFIGRDLGITTISMIHGDALGGGFEAALSSHVLVAEKRANFGLPEVLFNMFPGMGAYNLLSHRLNPAMAERLILSGQRYSAEQMFEMGLIDILAGNGSSEQAVDQFIKSHKRHKNTRQALGKIKSMLNPLDYQQLLEIGDIWVDSALSLGEREIRIMQRLIHGQTKLLEDSRHQPLLASASTG